MDYDNTDVIIITCILLFTAGLIIINIFWT